MGGQEGLAQKKIIIVFHEKGLSVVSDFQKDTDFVMHLLNAYTTVARDSIQKYHKCKDFECHFRQATIAILNKVKEIDEEHDEIHKNNDTICCNIL